MRLFYNIPLLLCLWAAPALAQEPISPVVFKGIYEFKLGAVPFGRIGIEAEQTAKDYAGTIDIKTTGLARLFVPHQSHTSVEGSGEHFSYSNSSYETRYQTRKKKRYVKMRRENNVMVEEMLDPPENYAKRPRVETSLKNDAYDPLSFLFAMRKAIASGKEKFSIRVFDGRRLTQINFTMQGKRSITYNDKPVAVVVAKARREMIAGFTDSEKEDFDPKEPDLFIYASDDGRYVPLLLEAKHWLGTLSARLVKECRTGESCLLQ